MKTTAIESIVRKDYKQVDINDTVSKILPQVEKSSDIFVVTNAGLYAGMLRARDLAKKTSIHEDMKVQAVMRLNQGVQKDASMQECVKRFVETSSLQLPVLDENSVIGIIAATDIFKIAEEELKQSKIEEIMSKRLITARPKDTLGKLLSLFRDFQVSRIPIVEFHKTRGIVTAHDVVSRVFRPFKGGAPTTNEKRTLLDIEAQDIMTKEVITLPSDASLAEAAQIFRERKIGSVLVTQAGRTTGILTKKDLVEYLAHVWQDQKKAVEIQFSSKIPDLEKESMIEELSKFTEKYSEQLGLGLISLHISAHREKHREDRLLHCRMRVRTQNLEANVTAEGFGEDRVVRHALRKLKTIVLKKKSTHHNFAAEEYLEDFDLSDL